MPQLMSGSPAHPLSSPWGDPCHSWWKKDEEMLASVSFRCRCYAQKMPFSFLSSHIMIFKNLFYSQSSVNLSNKLMLKIMTNNPIVTIINSANPNQPSIIAEVPTPLLTLPLPRSWAMVLAATDAVCCHNTDTSTKTDATKISARAIWETGREGKGFTLRSEPRSSISSCQPGKVARSTKQKKARIMATILRNEHLSWVSKAIWYSFRGGNRVTHIR